MHKLKSKSDVVEWYWPDFLDYCLRACEYVGPKLGAMPIVPTVDNFWAWYIEDGPLGVKRSGRFYVKTEVTYV